MAGNVFVSADGTIVDEDGNVIASGDRRTIVDTTDDQLTLSAEHLNALILVGDGSQVRIPAEADEDLGEGFQCDLGHIVSGDAAVIPENGVDLNDDTDSWVVDEAGAATLVKLPGVDTWFLFGAVTVD